MKELDLINNMLALPTIVENGSVTTDEFGRPVEPPRINMLEVNLRKSIQEAKLAEDVTENKSSDEVDVISSIVGIDEGARQSYGDPRQLSKGSDTNTPSYRHGRTELPPHRENPPIVPHGRSVVADIERGSKGNYGGGSASLSKGDNPVGKALMPSTLSPREVMSIARQSDREGRSLMSKLVAGKLRGRKIMGVPVGADQMQLPFDVHDTVRSIITSHQDLHK